MTSIFRSPLSDLPAPAAGLEFRRHQIRHWMQACRDATLALFQAVDNDQFCQQAHPEFSPIGWHLGHIAYTEALWLLEHLAGMPPQFPQYRRLFAADTLPKTERVHLPPISEVQAYLKAVRSQVFDYLETAPLEHQERLWRWLLQHESQHCETIALVLELQRPTHPPTSITVFSAPPRLITIPAGPFQMGSDAIAALDNERPIHWVELEAYQMDSHPVTWGQYRAFIEAGGYQTERWWSPEGWQWVRSTQVQHPRYGANEPDRDQHPVCGVSWYEADAYARFVGKRLPTEAEWEKAASWNPVAQRRQTYPWGETAPTSQVCNYFHHVGGTTPVDRYPQGGSPYGCYDLLGNVWEWTASWFDGYRGFEPYPYRGYSQAYFDQSHRVLKGGSWATRPWTLRSSFRNWYHPHVREISAGFRCAAN